MRKLFLALTLASSIAVASPFNGHWATTPKACNARADQLNDNQYNLTITPKIVRMVGWNFVRVERVEDVLVSNNRSFVYSGHYQEQWENDNSNGTTDTNWTLNNGVLKIANNPIKFRKCK